MGSNLFLGKEMETSAYLYSFIKNQGAPDAIEIVEPVFDNVAIYLYYFHRKETYIAELNINQESREWIVKGPHIPTWRKLKALENVIDLSKKDAPFMINGQEFFFPQLENINQNNITEKSISPTQMKLPKAPKKPIRKYQAKRTYKPLPKKNINNITITTPQESFLIQLENLTSYTPINSDKMAIAMSKGYARRNNNGDVIHVVKSYTETLQAISNWYTGTAFNAVKIEQTSNLKDASSLKIGDTIIIPFNLLKRVKQMPL